MASEKEVERLKELDKRVATLEHLYSANGLPYHSSDYTETLQCRTSKFPEHGMPARHVHQIIVDTHAMDENERLNTSSYVNVVFEPEELEVAKLGMSINLADQTVYPVTYQVHDKVINLLAKLWNCPDSDAFLENGVHAGAGTVGSTEACLLAGLALKFRWRDWYSHRHNLSPHEVRRVVPNMVITTMFQACWEKFFKYMDVEARIVKPSYESMVISPADVEKQIDENTIGVVCVLGNHYSGHYDPVHEVDAVVNRVNKENGWQVGIHIDGASGAFVAPFQDEIPPWDFRLPSVMSISASGHKFGESVCGTGWVVWRQREQLSEHIAISVSYLGGNADSYTLNFSRPASGILVQYYKILRLGFTGYKAKVAHQMNITKYLRDRLRAMEKDGEKRFVMLDAGSDQPCLPVVAAMLNPKLKLPYTDIDLQHTISDDRWYVCGYHMEYSNPNTGEEEDLFNDIDASQTMFRIVVKSNLTMTMAENLANVFERAVAWLDENFRHVELDSLSPLLQSVMKQTPVSPDQVTPRTPTRRRLMSTRVVGGDTSASSISGRMFERSQSHAAC
mmetsp:Transcript_26529/g.103340  ORF Transcript_26529/g.103340 Transcript_26529/m.103340 type:complete len:563 (-) Transcript_26529:354-2042(-)